MERSALYILVDDVYIMGYSANGTNLRPMVTNSLPFKGRVGVGMGLSVAKQPNPIPTLKGKGR